MKQNNNFTGPIEQEPHWFISFWVLLFFLGIAYIMIFAIAIHVIDKETKIADKNKECQIIISDGRAKQIEIDNTIYPIYNGKFSQEQLVLMSPWHKEYIFSKGCTVIIK
jgi:hypothetical protein